MVRVIRWILIRWRLRVPLFLAFVAAALVGCVATSGGYRAELYSAPAGSYADTHGVRARPLAWIFFHNNRTAEMYGASRAAETTLDSCGFRVEGVAFADSGVRTSPPHQFRLDVAVAEEPSLYQDRLGAYHEYAAVRVDARMIRAADNSPVTEWRQSIGYYGADGLPHSILQSGVRIRAGAYEAFRVATESAVRSVCYPQRSWYYDSRSYGAAYPYDAPYGQTLMGYGACGRTTKSGAWDLRYQHSSPRGCR